MEAYITEKRVRLARKDVLAGTRSNEHATNFLSHVNMHDPTVDSIPRAMTAAFRNSKQPN